MDKAGNQSSATVTFTVEASIESLLEGVDRLADEGQIDNKGIQNSLNKKLKGALDDSGRHKTAVVINKLKAFINEVEAQWGKHITEEAADLLIADARWVIDKLE